MKFCQIVKTDNPNFVFLLKTKENEKKAKNMANKIVRSLIEKRNYRSFITSFKSFLEMEEFYMDLTCK